MQLPSSLDRVGRRWAPQTVTVIRLAAALVLAGCLCGAIAAIGGRLEEASRAHAVGQAELVAELGFATAMSDGQLTTDDTRVAAAQTAVAREALGVTRVVVWDRSGAVFSDPGPDDDAAPPPLVLRTLSDGSTTSGTVDHDGSPGRFAVVVALDKRYAAELDFAEAPMQDTLTTARRVAYGLILAEAVAVYLALGPALSWAAERLPSRADRRQSEAVATVRTALDDGELELWYQPKVAVATGEVQGWRPCCAGVTRRAACCRPSRSSA